MLFCSQFLEVEDCERNASQFPALTTYQEHNRFYREITNANSYQASNDLSDALFAMYRYSDGGLEDSAIAGYKQERLLAAWERYNQLRQDIFSTPAAGVLFNWSMRSFDGGGNAWLKQMHKVVNDRNEALLQLLDLKRRILLNANEADYSFVHHLLHQEYLSQIFLIGLQKKWQGEEFSYTGSGARMIEQGDLLLQRVNQIRNPLGLHPNQVYFENSNLNSSNWQHYKIKLALPPLVENSQKP